MARRIVWFADDRAVFVHGEAVNFFICGMAASMNASSTKKNEETEAARAYEKGLRDASIFRESRGLVDTSRLH